MKEKNTLKEKVLEYLKKTSQEDRKVIMIRIGILDKRGKLKYIYRP